MVHARVRSCLLIALAASTVAGCASAPTVSPRGEMKCPRGVCEIPVHVRGGCTGANDVFLDEGNRTIAVDRPVLIRWRITERNYVFAPDAIKVMDDDDQFVPIDPGSRTNVYLVLDEYRKPNTYKYSIALQKDDGTRCWVLDPFIRNN